MNLTYWIRNPGFIIPRLKYLLWEYRNPEKPWLTSGAVVYLEKVLNKGMAGFEFGSGRSTGWFAQKLGSLVSIEHDETWYHRVRAMLDGAGVTNIEYRLVPLDHLATLPEQPVYDPLPRYVSSIESAADETLDFVVVDGHYRTACISKSLSKLKPGGLLLVDDLNLWPDRRAIPVPSTWTMTHESTNGIKSTGVWRK
jgi:Methyltransferase domain